LLQKGQGQIYEKLRGYTILKEWIIIWYIL
jgi:hypothetical protein